VFSGANLTDVRFVAPGQTCGTRPVKIGPVRRFS
jgi:hypothetical protein